MVWRDIDFDNHAIRFQKHKTMNYDYEISGQVRAMTAQARELLIEFKKQAGLKDSRLHDLRYEATKQIVARCGHYEGRNDWHALRHGQMQRASISLSD